MVASREYLDVPVGDRRMRIVWQLYDAEHAFGRDLGARYDPEATDRAFAATVDLFRRALTP
jgi:hypothetical protein